jgi:hypothetical protein
MDGCREGNGRPSGCGTRQARSIETINPVELTSELQHVHALTAKRRSKHMQQTFGIVMLAFAVMLIWVGKANADGSVKSFLRSDFLALLYPVFCLVVLSAGVGLLVG